MKQKWRSLVLTVAGLLLVGSWFIPGWKQVELNVTSGESDRFQNQAVVSVTTSRSDLPFEGGCGHASCPGSSRNSWFHDDMDIHIPIMDATPVVESVHAVGDQIDVTISYTGAPGRGLRTGIEKSNHWVLTVRARKGLIGGRTVQVHTVQSAIR